MKKKLQTKFSNRQYMLSKDFELYYYNNYPETAVGPHKHNNYEFYFFLEGDITITIDNKTYVVKPGDFMIYPPNMRHYPTILSRDKPYRRFVLWVSIDYCNSLLSESKDYAYLMQYAATNKDYLFSPDPINFNSIHSMIFRLIEELKSDRFGKEAEITNQIKSLILSLNRMVYEKNTQSNFSYEKKLYINLCTYILAHLEEDLSLDRLAREFYVSKFHISHTFKENIGISVHQYITKKRLHACKDALLSSIPISKIYERYGFNDYSGFFRAFKKEYGISPKEYKEKYYTSTDGL